MKKAWCALFIAWLFFSCSKSRYAHLADADSQSGEKARKMWSEYTAALSDPANGTKPLFLARFFDDALLSHTEQKAFEARLKKAFILARSGLFSEAKLKAVKVAEGGLLLVLDSKAGEATVPARAKAEGVLLADLRTATGDWTGEPAFGPSSPAEKPSLLFLLRLLENDDRSLGERLRAAVAMARPEFRSQIVQQMQRQTDPIIRLGLGLARVKIDGWDESFLKNFPVSAEGLNALQNADGEVFDEMMTKLFNMALQVEDPPANEVLFKAAAGAPQQLRARFAAALYELGENGPARFANAVRSLAPDKPQEHPAVKLYLEEFERRGGKAPKLEAFLKKFASIGEPEEQKLCRVLLGLLKKK